ncbi:MAG TPA: GNAT family N-acetyltransferase [Acidimicrobiia bacterium]|nr:GNAT family N-acetyltransferase [Acidimicrobiia bacterium]
MHPSERLQRHLASWLGVWPPPGPGLTVVGSDRRVRPGWDGGVRVVAGVATPDGTVLSVPPDRVGAVRALGPTLDDIGDGLGDALDTPGGRLFSGVFRWSEDPAPDPGRGVWLPNDDPRVLPWLHPFNGEVLVGFESDAVAAGVGRKQHDRWGHELAVVTEPGHRGRGWASDLVAQAAHRVLADGAVPTYLHAEHNEGSARTADAAGFPDRGWSILGFSRPTN